MADIQLVNKKTGKAVSCPLAQLDWSAMIASGISPFTATMANVSDVTDTHKDFYYLDNVDVSSFITDTIKPDSKKTLFYVGSLPKYRDNFQPESAALPWSTFDSVDTWQVPVQNAAALEGHGTFTPNRLYYSNATVCTDYRTANGGEIGGSVGLYAADGNVHAVMCIGAKQTSYIRGLYQQYNADYCARWGGNGCIDFSTHPTRNYSTAPVAEVLGVQTIDPIPTPAHLIAQCVYTVINGYKYIAMCAIRTDGDGNAQLLSGVFIPAWFWGDFDTPITPDEKPNYYGRDAVPSGGDGYYSYTNTTITIPTAENPFSSVLHDGHGVHVYSISTSIYDEVCSTLWGDGTFSSALWKKWQNYKFNPIAAIVGCHKLPYQLSPRGTFSQVDCRASGCPLTHTTSAYYVNSKTTVDHSCGSVSFTEKYFGNFMDYEPYTSVNLYLPFCGWMSVPSDRVIGGVIYVDYRCDIITGNVVAYVRCVDQTGQQTYTTTATGNAAVSIPVTGNDNGTGSVVGAITAGLGIAAVGLATGGSAALIAGAAGAGLGSQTGRHVLQQSGQVSGNVGMINQLQPFLFVTLPIDVYSDLWRDLHGIRSHLPVTISDLTGTGHTVFSDVHADSISCTSAEQAEIENILKSGVIL